MLTGLAEFRENFRVEIRCDPKSGNPYQFIDHRFAQVDQASAFRSGYHSKETGNCQACRRGGPTPAPLVHKQEVRAPLDCKHNCLSFTRIQMLAKFVHTGLVFRTRDYQPGLRSKVDHRRQILLGCRQFLKHSRGNEYLSIQHG